MPTRKVTGIQTLAQRWRFSSALNCFGETIIAACIALHSENKVTFTAPLYVPSVSSTTATTLEQCAQVKKLA